MRSSFTATSWPKCVALAAARGLPRQEALAFVADLEDSFEITVAYVDELMHRAALALLQRRLDKTWSLCDAVSFVLMERFSIAAARNDRSPLRAGRLQTSAGRVTTIALSPFYAYESPSLYYLSQNSRLFDHG